MALRSSTLSDLRSLLRTILPVFGPLGRDVAVRGERGEVLLTNRGGVVMRGKETGEGVGVALVLKLARKKVDFSVSFVIAVYALCEVLARSYQHTEAATVLRTIEGQFEALFDVRDICNQSIPIEEMRDYIANTGLAGKLSPSLRTAILATAKELIGPDCSVSALKAITKDFPVYRIGAALQVAKHTIVLKGTCKRLIYNRVAPAAVLIIPATQSKNIHSERQIPGKEYVGLQMALEAVILDYKVKLVVNEGELEPWVRDLIARLEGVTGFAVSNYAVCHSSAVHMSYWTRGFQYASDFPCFYPVYQ